MSYFIFLIAFAISSATVPPIRALAKSNGAIALPGKRHIHTTPIPKFGGIAIALSVFIISAFIFSIDRVIASFLASTALMLLLGIIDDVKGAKWNLKLLLSLGATSIFIFGSGIWIKSLGNLFGTGEIQLGLWGIPFTYFAVFGVINAINLIDGLDGLASGVSSIAFTSFAVFAYMSGNNTVFYLSLINLGATLGLLRYNYPKAKIFIGDSGSLFIGFSLSVLAILLTQGSNTIKPMVPVLILGIPIFDTLRVMIIRIIHKRNPFHGDKTHLHHLMHRSGIPTNQVVKRIWALSCVMSLLALALYSFDSWLMLLIYANVAFLMGIFIENLRILKLARNCK
jgi:UDP-GlcNAc:undecaprenyl-phosphate GlcNAc-1-phosphate transferase